MMVNSFFGCVFRLKNYHAKFAEGILSSIWRPQTLLMPKNIFCLFRKVCWDDFKFKMASANFADAKKYFLFNPQILLMPKIKQNSPAKFADVILSLKWRPQILLAPKNIFV